MRLKVLPASPLCSSPKLGIWRRWVNGAAYVILACVIFVTSCQGKMGEVWRGAAVANDNGRVRTDGLIVDPELEKNREKWRAQSIAHYKITITASQGGNITFPGPAEIEVMNGTMSKLTIPSIAEVDGRVIQRWEPVNTVDKIFDLMEKGYAEGLTVEAEYDEEFGYPKDVVIKDVTKIDAWTTVEIADFEPMDR
jgi:hypothetical protein